MDTDEEFRLPQGRLSVTQPQPLDTLRATFRWLSVGPHPLVLDGRAFAGLPDRQLTVAEVRRLLLAHSCPQPTRDAAWAHLVGRARADGGAWTVACAAMAAPALIGPMWWLTTHYPGDPFDVQAEVLAGFLRALQTVDVRRPRILLRLRWAAYRAGHAALEEALDAPQPVPADFRSAPPRPAAGHPDFVLAEAVRASVLTRTEADLIGSTRLEQVPIVVWAEAHGMGVAAAYKLRRRAEFRLAAHLSDRRQDLEIDDVIYELQGAA